MKPMGGRTWKYWPASGPVFGLPWDYLSRNLLQPRDVLEPSNSKNNFHAQRHDNSNIPQNSLKAVYLIFLVIFQSGIFDIFGPFQKLN